MNKNGRKRTRGCARTAREASSQREVSRGDGKLHTLYCSSCANDGGETSAGSRFPKTMAIATADNGGTIDPHVPGSAASACPLPLPVRWEILRGVTFCMRGRRRRHRPHFHAPESVTGREVHGRGAKGGERRRSVGRADGGADSMLPHINSASSRPLA